MSILVSQMKALTIVADQRARVYRQPMQIAANGFEEGRTSAALAYYQHRISFESVNLSITRSSQNGQQFSFSQDSRKTGQYAQLLFLIVPSVLRTMED